MRVPGILVYERRPRWEAALKRQQSPQYVFIRGCRTPASIREQLTERPGSVLVLDLDAGPADCLRLAGAVTVNRLQASPIMIAATTMSELEWPARELGVIDFLPDTIRSDQLFRLCLRQLPAAPDANEELFLDLIGGA